MREGRGAPGEVFFEFTQLGHQMRVVAIDAATATEVVIIAPLTATQIQMQGIALAKLQKKLAASGSAGPAAASPDPAKGRIA